MTALRWATPVVLAVELVLVLTGRLSFGGAVVLFGVVEAALALAAFGQAAVGVRGYRHARRGGADREAACAAAARAALPGPIAAVVVHEARLIQSLALWVRGRRHGVPPGAVAIGYGRDSRAVGLALLGVSVVEVVAVELLVPWAAVRLVLLVLGIYGVVVVLALIVDPIVRPHVLTRDSLRLRVGTRADIILPLDSITTIHRRPRHADRPVTFTGTALVLGPGGQTQLEVDLSQPRSLQVGRRCGVAHGVRFSADDPAAAAAAITAALRAGQASRSAGAPRPPSDRP